MLSFKCKMNEIVNKCLLAGNRFMPEMHLKQPGFTYSACGPFTKKKKIETFMQTGNTDQFKFFDKKSSGRGVANEPNYQLTNELHKRIIKEFKKKKVYSSFRDNIWGVDLAHMQSLSKYNKGNKYVLCAVDIFSKYAWVDQGS